MAGHSTGKIVVIVGPVAAGKTTQRILLRSYLQRDRRTLALAIPPFSFVTHCFLRVVSSIAIAALGRSVVRSGKRRHPLATLEAIHPALLGRVLKLLLALDAVQHVVLLLALHVVVRLNVYLIVEDLSPAMLTDHAVYLRIYGRGSQVNGKILGALYALICGPLTRKLSKNLQCVYLEAPASVRRERSLARKEGWVVESVSMHDQWRGSILKRVSSQLCGETVIVDTSQGSPREICRTIVARLGL